MKKVVLASLLLSAFVFAEENVESLKAEIERLNAQLEIKRLQAELQQLEQPQPANIAEVEDKDALHEARQNLREAMRNNMAASFNESANKLNAKTEEKLSARESDTTVESIGNVSKVIHDNREWQKNNFIGIAGGPAVGAMYLDVRPIRDFLRDVEKNDQLLKRSGLVDRISDREPAFLIGGFGYGSFGTGAIAGGGGYGILTQITANVEDTVIVTTIGGGYGGFIIGGSWSNRKNAFSITTLLGGGGLGVTLNCHENGKFRWSNSNKDDKKDKDKDKDKNKKDDEYEIDIDGTSFFAAELQLAYTHSFARWFHVGLETAGLVMYSRRGFNYTDDFLTVNPSVKLRLVFGSI